MLRRSPHSPHLGGLPLGLGCPLFALSDALTSLKLPQSRRSNQNLPSGLSFCARLSWSAPLRLWIVSSHHFTTAVTEGDGSVRVPGHKGSKQPTSNSKPTLRNGARYLRNSHVAFGDIGGRGPCQRWICETSLGFIAQDFAMPM